MPRAMLFMSGAARTANHALKTLQIPAKDGHCALKAGVRIPITTREEPFAEANGVANSA